MFNAGETNKVVLWTGQSKMFEKCGIVIKDLFSHSHRVNTQSN